MAKRDGRTWCGWLAAGALCGVLTGQVALSQIMPVMPQPQPAPAGRETGGSLRLIFNMAPVEIVLDAYSEQTGRTILMAPDVNKGATITLRSQGDLTQGEYLEAIETVLGMHGIALLKEGERFLRVVSNKQAREEPMPIRTYDTADELVDSGELISQMIPLKHIEAAEAGEAVKPLMHSGYGKINTFQGINSVLITDSAANVNRVMQVLGYIDQPIEAREEPIVVQIRYAKASEVKAKLLQIIEESQKEQARSTVQRTRDSGAPGVERAAAVVDPPGVIRARVPRTPEVLQEIMAEAERGIIRGQVKIVEDDRTNILILITRPENMAFFEKIIQVLDVETDPDVMVRVFRLEYAEAKDIATMLNDLIGATSEEGRAATPAAGGAARTGEGSAALREFVEQRQTQSQEGAAVGVSKVGQLSKDDIKILSDERTNALIIMASKGDMAAIAEIIDDMDLMLSQVLVEAVILEVSLDDSLESGVDWVQRALLTYGEGPNGRRPKMAFAGSGGGSVGIPVVNPLTLTSPGAFPSGDAGSLAGLSYYFTFFDLNIDAVLRAVASDSRTRILSSPVILTTDNKNATIDVATDRYFFKGKKYVGGTGESALYEDDVERQKVGIKLAVTPRINEKKYVVMEIEQTIENVSGSQRIEGNDWPIVTSRKFEADVAVRSGDTVVLGGLVVNEDSNSKSKIPILGDIPVLGIPFRSKQKGQTRAEVIVFITPYVLDTPEEIYEDAVRRQDALSVGDMWERGWSDSPLALPRRVDAEGVKPVAAEAPVVPEVAPIPIQPVAVPPPAIVERTDPMAALDPELRDYIRREDRRWRRNLERVDRAIDRERGE